MTTEFQSNSLAETHEIGRQILNTLTFPCCVYLTGELGAGKTSLCQAIIHAAGYLGAVSSPTYNLIQEYPVSGGTIYHMDLYRLEDPDELEYLAIEDLWSEDSLFLIEWPDKAQGRLYAADLSISIERNESHEGQSRLIKLS